MKYEGKTIVPSLTLCDARGCAFCYVQVLFCHFQPQCEMKCSGCFTFDNDMSSVSCLIVSY